MLFRSNEIYAHAVNEHVPLKEVVEATRFYALLPFFIGIEGAGSGVDGL